VGAKSNWNFSSLLQTFRGAGCSQEAKEKAMAGKNQASQREIERAINGGWWESGESRERQKESIYQLPTTKSFGQELDMRRGNVLGKKVRVQMLRDSQKTRNVKSSKTTRPEKKWKLNGHARLVFSSWILGRRRSPFPLHSLLLCQLFSPLLERPGRWPLYFMQILWQL